MRDAGGCLRGRHRPVGSKVGWVAVPVRGGRRRGGIAQQLRLETDRWFHTTGSMRRVLHAGVGSILERGSPLFLAWASMLPCRCCRNEATKAGDLASPVLLGSKQGRSLSLWLAGWLQEGRWASVRSYDCLRQCKHTTGTYVCMYVCKYIYW